MKGWIETFSGMRANIKARLAQEEAKQKAERAAIAATTSRKQRGLYWEAIKELPEQYVDDGTDAIMIMSDTVLAVNAKHPPLMYKRGSGKWVVPEFKIVPPSSVWPICHDCGQAHPPEEAKATHEAPKTKH